MIRLLSDAAQSQMSTENQTSNALLQIAVPLIDTHLTTLLAFLWRLSQRTLGERVSPGDYEILEYEAQLELMDVKGEKAIFSKREKVRFLQNNTIAYQDMAWGVGNIFASYTCSPGVPVDTYREGHRYRVLISLREAKHKGDITEFHILRDIEHGFTEPLEDFQHEVSHIMRFASISIIFPKRRHPKSIVLIEQNSTRRFSLGAKYRRLLPDGRLEVMWRTHHPRLFEAYIMHWNW